MMRFPARLTAQLAKARIARIFNSTLPSSLVHCVDPAAVLHPGSGAPVIWIGGNEPLLHPGIGHFVRAIAQSRHFVFLETDGTHLRRRIHEFQPLPQVFLTVRLGALHGSDSALALEGLRAARLSGFLTVVHSTVRDNTVIAELRGIRSFISENDVDGWLVTAASSTVALVREAAEARGLIAGRFWRQFSERVEDALMEQLQGKQLTRASSVEEPRGETREESVRVA